MIILFPPWIRPTRGTSDLPPVRQRYRVSIRKEDMIAVRDEASEAVLPWPIDPVARRAMRSDSR